MVCCGRVEDGVVVKRVLGDQGSVIQVAKNADCSGLLDLFGMLFPPNVPGYSITLSNEKIKNIPPDKTRTNDEDLLT